MELKYGKFLAFGLLLLTIAGCSKPKPNLTEDEFKANRDLQQKEAARTQAR